MSRFSRELTTTPPKYPAAFPCPLQSGYNAVDTYGVARTQMATGRTRQRRFNPYKLTTVTMTFRMTVEVLRAWHEFVHQNAFIWISMPAQTADIQGVLVQYETMRFISGVSFTYMPYDVVQATVNAELWINEVVADPTEPGLVVSPLDLPPPGGGMAGGVAGPGDGGDPTSDPAGTIQLLDGIPQYDFNLDAAPLSLPFRSTTNPDHYGTFIAGMEPALQPLRLWISATAGGTPIALGEVSGYTPILRWGNAGGQGVAELATDTLYYLNLEITNASQPVGITLTVASNLVERTR